MRTASVIDYRKAQFEKVLREKVWMWYSTWSVAIHSSGPSSS